MCRSTFVWLVRFRYDGFQKIDNFGCIPFGGADHAPGLVAGAVDDQRRRQADRTEASDKLTGAIDVFRKMAQTGFGVEFVHDVDSAAIDGDRDYFEAGAAQGSLQAVERGHFLAAGDAPGGPDVEHDHLAAEIGKASCLSASIRKVDRRDRPGRRVHDEGLCRLLPDGELSSR